jgi:pimeloyl-ACP methyl ester carboxylesterase
LPFLSLNHSPLAPQSTPVKIHYRETGSGPPLVFLHGGWGYGAYPFDRQAEAFKEHFKIVIPDRTGYGRSMRIESLPVDFHRRAADEMMQTLDALDLDRAVLWGHSDGAVIATFMGLAAPGRFRGLILEAFHFFRLKPGSWEFFEKMMADPMQLGERLCSILPKEHGEDYWRTLLALNGGAWLKIAQESKHATDDLYAGRLSELRVPTLFIHGRLDPRTEPGEMEAVSRQLPRARIEMIEGARHSPHSERASAAESNRVAGEFFRSLGLIR